MLNLFKSTIFKHFGFDNERVIGHQKLTSSWVANAQMTVLNVKFFNFQSVEIVGYVAPRFQR